MSALMTQAQCTDAPGASPPCPAEALLGGGLPRINATLAYAPYKLITDPGAKAAMADAISGARRQIAPLAAMQMLKTITRFATPGLQVFVWAKRIGAGADVAQEHFDAVRGHEDAVRWLVRHSVMGWNTYISTAVFHPWATQRLNSGFHHTALVYTDCDDAKASQAALALHDGLGIPGTFYNVTGASVLDLDDAGQPVLCPSGGLALNDDKRVHTYHVLSAPFPALDYWKKLPPRPLRLADYGDDRDFFENAVAKHGARVEKMLAPISAKLHAAKALVGGIDLGEEDRPVSSITDISTIDEARVLRCAGTVAWPLGKSHRSPEIPYRVEVSGREYTIEEIRAADPQRFDRLEAWYTENRGTTGGGVSRAKLDNSGPAREDIHIVIEAALQAAQIKLAARNVGDRNTGSVWFGRTLGPASPALISVEAIVDAAEAASPLGSTSDTARQVKNGIAMAQGNTELRGFNLDHPRVDTLVEAEDSPLSQTAVRTVVNAAVRYVEEGSTEYPLGAFYLTAYWIGSLVGGRALSPDSARFVLHLVGRVAKLHETHADTEISAVVEFQLYEGAQRPRSIAEILKFTSDQRALRVFADSPSIGDRRNLTASKGSFDDYENF